MGEGNWSGHELRGFVAGKTEHQSLIAGALLGRAFALGRGVIDTLLNVAGLLAHFANHPAGIGVKNAIAVHISNAANRLANALFEIKLRVARNLAGEHDEVAFGEGLASDATERVLIETGIKNVIADRVADFIGMTFGNGFGGKDVAMRHG